MSDVAVAGETGVAEAAQAAVQCLPANAGWTVRPAEPGDDLSVGEGSGAVGVALAAGHRLAIVANKALARQVQVGPPPAEDLLDGLTPAVEAAAGAFGGALEAPAVLTAQAAVAAGAGDVLQACMLLDGDEVMASVVVVGPAAPEPDDESGSAPHEFAPLPDSTSVTIRSGLELLHDVEMGVTAELGRARMLVRDVLALSPGSVIELDRTAGSPVDVLVNGTLIARGEVVVVDEEFGIRITEIVGHVLPDRR